MVRLALDLAKFAFMCYVYILIMTTQYYDWALLKGADGYASGFSLVVLPCRCWKSRGGGYCVFNHKECVMRKLLVAVFSGLMMVSAVSAVAAPEAFGVVDYQKLGQAISFQNIFKSKMDAAIGTSSADMATLSKAMQEKQKQLDDKNAKLSDAQKKELTDAIAEQQKKLASMQAESQKKAMEVRTSLGNDLKKKVEDATGRVAAKHNLSLVLVNNSVAWAGNKVDITDELIAEVAKALGVTPIPASQQTPMGMNPRQSMMMKKGISPQ
jgi:Skp family chaperone for outer membrane proteins